MPKLSDLHASLLLQEIACAMRMGVPLDQSLRRLSSRRLGTVGRMAGEIADGIEQGLTVSAALSPVDPGGQATAAVQACESSGDVGLLESLAFQLERRAQIRSESRLSWFYPLVLLTVGYFVAAAVLAPLVRRFHADGILWTDSIIGIARWLGTWWWIPPTLALIFLVPLVVWSRRRTRYSRPLRLSLFCSALADQILYDRPEAAAIGLAADFSGDPELQQIADPSLSSPALATVIDDREAWQRIVSGGDKTSIVAALRFRALQYEESARRRDFFWMRLLPRSLMVLAGGGMVLAYVWWILAPVYQQVGTW